ncbi:MULTISPECIES: hypothetical protein [Paenarthrobacter]|uniref:Uncharacterized protein n=1 Tax=Paenarthrobacter ureafaciens TaxID=37931 RepID=A0AAX3EDH1_PAEUR|nr:MULTISPECIES: hypothetical protein [Paenarthrobacter]NKR13286.1 hypothetical protein [Arthrobacter sp. M5]NKR14864.1 hypothetical protein [Arthrobacter sp. M6]OEH62416.1 hypothetical protein A5N13_01800 [Arthrobacter sp. D4]OEH62987.1 hypothetical protein A5N17_10040 [Arthrobacter sp. D2]MDO5865165.1 hypothetical protein [Paenarthrobacter sp. SD-2]
MPKIARAITELARAVADLAQQQGRTCTALNDVAREQRITNLIVRSQISADPEEKRRLVAEASSRMDAPRRRSPHDPA